jgi:hypothetical protein
MNSKSKEYVNNYFKDYIKKSKKVICNSCLGKYKEVYKHIHLKSNRHKNSIEFQKSFVEI